MIAFSKKPTQEVNIGSKTIYIFDEKAVNIDNKTVESFGNECIQLEHTFRKTFSIALLPGVI